MKKIVVPSDFSDNAFDALRFAAELFKYEKCEFFILHAYADEVYDSEDIKQESLEKIKEKVKNKSETRLDKVLLNIQEIYSNPNHNFRGLAAFGLLIDEVNDLVERENADLVISSTRGKTNDRKLNFGSNTLQMIKYLSCPVLSIPAEYKYRDLKKVLFPTNYMLPYKKRELKLLGDLVRALCAEVHMLCVSRFAPNSLRQQENKEIIEDQLYNCKLEYHQEEEMEKTEAIIKNIEDLEADLLVLVNSRHSYLENLLYTPTIDKIGFHPRIPFLVLQNIHRS